MKLQDTKEASPTVKQALGKFGWFAVLVLFIASRFGLYPTLIAGLILFIVYVLQKSYRNKSTVEPVEESLSKE